MNHQTPKGTVKSGFEKVKAVFAENFKKRGELGASCCAFYRGEKVVDLWGGIRDEATGAAWEEDTMSIVFSTTKGVSSMAMAHAHSQGLFDYDDPVTQYWPEFAANGKAEITIRQVLSHQAGLCAIDEPLGLEQLGNPDALAAAIGIQKPAWTPGEKHGYHGISLGWYESEIIRRADPQGRTIGQYFSDEIAKPLGLDFYIGLPDDIPRSRLATIKGNKPWQMLFNLNKMPFGFVRHFLNPKSLTARSFMNPIILGKTGNYNKPALQRIEIAAANGIGNARSVAKAYSEFATGGKILGLKPTTLAALEQPATTPTNGSMDQVLHIKTAYALGYLKPSPEFQFGSSSKAYGTPGAGGSFGFADPDAQLSFAYTMNKCGFYLFDDPREKALRDAVYECIKKV
ncbi:MAG: serine hydrolase domain-containing protein [Saprospiraceae bacterium]